MPTKIKGVAKRVDLVVEQGATFDATITWKDPNTGNPYDLTGYKARMAIKLDISDTSPVTNGSLSTENSTSQPYIVLGGTNGTIRMVIPSTITSGYSFDVAVYDLEVYKDTVTPEDVTRVIYGYITLSKEVTT